MGGRSRRIRGGMLPLTPSELTDKGLTYPLMGGRRRRRSRRGGGDNLTPLTPSALSGESSVDGFNGLTLPVGAGSAALSGGRRNRRSRRSRR